MWCTVRLPLNSVWCEFPVERGCAIKAALDFFFSSLSTRLSDRWKRWVMGLGVAVGMAEVDAGVQRPLQGVEAPPGRGETP